MAGDEFDFATVATQFRACFKNLPAGTPFTHFRASLERQYAKVDIPVEATLKKLLADEDNRRTYNAATIDMLKAFWCLGFKFRSDEYSCYRSLLQMQRLTIASQGRINDFVGQYSVFRQGKDEIIEGTLNISDIEIPWFRHSTTQKFGGKEKTYIHEGFIFLVENRLYLLGVGKDYVRQMSIRAVPRPHEMAMPGIVLTERTEDVDQREAVAPLAAKTVLVSEKIPPLQPSQILSYLKNESSIPGVVYGWRENG